MIARNTPRSIAPREAVPLVREILAATDFSEPAEAAFRVARDYARSFGAQLHLLHVGWSGADPTVPPLLSKLGAELAREVRVVTAVEAGTPATRSSTPSATGLISSSSALTAERA